MVEAQLQNVRALRLLQSNQEQILAPPPALSVALDQETLEAVNNLITADPSLRFWPMTMTPPPAPPPSPAIVSTPKKPTRSRTRKQAKTLSMKVLKKRTSPSRNAKTLKRKIVDITSIHANPNTSSSVASTSTHSVTLVESINPSINSSLLDSNGSNIYTCNSQPNVTSTSTSTSTASVSTSYLPTTLVGNGIFSDSTFIAQFSQIMFLFSQIFDFIIVPSITFSSAFCNSFVSSNPLCQSLAAGSAQNDPTILIFLYRQIIFTEFQNSLKYELLVQNAPCSASALPLTIDKLLSIFCASCRKLGINL